MLDIHAENAIWILFNFSVKLHVPSFVDIYLVVICRHEDIHGGKFSQLISGSQHTDGRANSK